MRMIGNYLQIALRILRRHKLLSVIEVGSLSLAFGFCILTYALISREWSYDSFHENGAHLYRVVFNAKTPGYDRMKWGDHTPVAMAEVLQNAVPQVEETVRLVSGRGTSLELRRIRVRRGDTWNDEPFLVVDENFFEVFTFAFEAGNPRTALRVKDGIVVSRDFAHRYFGDEPALGQVVRIEVGWPKPELKEYTIQAVVAPSPNSSIQLNVLLPFHNSEPLWRWIDDFWKRNCILFVRLREDANGDDREQAEALMQQLYVENAPYYEKLVSHKIDFSLELQPLSALHTDTDVTMSKGYDGIAPPRDLLETYIVLAIAVLLLAVAIVNYVNLTTARASARGLEVGVRVALGATRRQLPVQFWMETVVVCGVSLVIGLALGEVLLPAFNAVLGQDLRLYYLAPPFIVGGLVLLVLTSLLAAAYPSLILARTNPSEAVRGTSLLSRRSTLGSALVIVQFAACAGLAGTSLVMARQLHHLQAFDLGLAADDVLMLDIDELPEGTKDRHRQLLKEKLLSHSGIKSVAMSEDHFLRTGTPRLAETILPGEDRKIRAQCLRVDPHFVETLGLQLVQGSDLGSDRANILVNETFVARAGWGQPIGQVVQFTESLGRKMPNGEGRVVGVLSDYHFYSLKSGVEPGVLLPDYYNNHHRINDHELLFVRLNPKAGNEVMEHIEREWKAVAPEGVLYLSWLEDHLAAYYRDDQIGLRVVGGAALLAVFIAALGAYGLTAITVSHQRRNIAFMRTLGAQGRHVAGLLARRLLWLVLAGGLLIGPLAYLGMEEWLSHFSQRIDDGWVFLGLGSLAAAATACASVLLHTVALMREPLAKGLQRE
ncbi:MAG: FtsX-like permease family protein [Gemmatimonadetes bacterium]|nr:FtsX-like permease family protein [Gemmatimonadota bacterium]